MSNSKNTPPKAPVGQWDAEELAAYICGLDPEDSETETVENALYEKFNTDIDNFREILCHLLPLIDVGESPLTGKRFKGFGYIDNAGFGTWAVKMEIPKPEKKASKKKSPKKAD